MLSLIITTNDSQKLQPHCPLNLDEPHPDILILESDTSIGIDAVRPLKQFTSMHPMKGDLQVIWIKEADRLTPEAQNALLKILEEPPGYTQIILSTASPDRLLPTVISRCQIVSIPKTQINPDEKNELTFKLAAEAGKTKNQALALCQSFIAAYHQELNQRPNLITAANLKLAEEIHYRISKNANPQLALEYLLLATKKSD